MTSNDIRSFLVVFGVGCIGVSLLNVPLAFAGWHDDHFCAAGQRDFPDHPCACAGGANPVPEDSCEFVSLAPHDSSQAMEWGCFGGDTGVDCTDGTVGCGRVMVCNGECTAYGERECTTIYPETQKPPCTASTSFCGDTNGQVGP